MVHPIKTFPIIENVMCHIISFYYFEGAGGVFIKISSKSTFQLVAIEGE